MDVDDSGGGDCSADGTCGDEGGLDDDDLNGDGNLPPVLSLLDQTENALQQFSIVVGVCLMVGLLFFLMVWIDMLMDWLGTKMKRSSKKEPDPEDPAALVGSFKRYKN